MLYNTDNELKFKIAKKKLPPELNDQDKINFIFDTFCNHEIEIIEKPNYYFLKLKRSPFLYCENKDSILESFGIGEYDVLNYFALKDKSIFCF